MSYPIHEKGVGVTVGMRMELERGLTAASIVLGSTIESLAYVTVHARSIV